MEKSAQENKGEKLTDLKVRTSKTILQQMLKKLKSNPQVDEIKIADEDVRSITFFIEE
jgi:hypothetical protein